MPDGMRLALRRWRPVGAARAVLLALHGFIDHGGNLMVEAGPLLAGAGVIVYAYDQRGFGHSPHRGLWPGAEALVADARQAVALIKARHPELPLFLLGESMGAAVAVLAAQAELPIAGVVLLAPAVLGRGELPPAAVWLFDLAAALAPGLAAAPAVGGIAASDNPAALARFARDPLVLREVRLDMLQGLMELMTQAVAALPGCCRVPVLMLSGGRDRVVPASIQRRVLARLPPSPQRRILFYPEGYHLLLRDQVRERVAADILAWMADRQAPLAAEEAARAWLAGR
ncbi:MAG: lysophospholipase [Rhodovarius sp.]|nr:lysophospholipase [Rhodovarius sp.]